MDLVQEWRARGDQRDSARFHVSFLCCVFFALRSDDVDGGLDGSARPTARGDKL